MISELDGFAGVPWDMHRAAQKGLTPSGQPQVEPNQQQDKKPTIGIPGAAAADAARGPYITRAHMERFGGTPGCPRCTRGSGTHTEECKARFRDLIQRAEMAEGSAPVAAAPAPVADGGAAAVVAPARRVTGKAAPSADVRMQVASQAPRQRGPLQGTVQARRSEGSSSVRR